MWICVKVWTYVWNVYVCLHLQLELCSFVLGTIGLFHHYHGSQKQPCKQVESRILKVESKILKAEFLF